MAQDRGQESETPSREAIGAGAMTCIVGVEAEGGAWIACDSCVSTGDDGRDELTEPKWFSQGGVYVGTAGDDWWVSLLRGKLHVEKFKRGEPVEEWIYRTIIPSLRKIVSEPGREFELLVVAQGQVYFIGNNLGAYRSKRGYLAIGSGCHHAEGSLYSTGRWTDSKRRATTAIRAAAEHLGSVSEPVIVKWVPA